MKANLNNSDGIKNTNGSIDAKHGSSSVHHAGVSVWAPHCNCLICLY